MPSLLSWRLLACPAAVTAAVGQALHHHTPTLPRVFMGQGDSYLSWCNSGAVVACSCLFPVQGAKYQLGTTQCCQLIIAFFLFLFLINSDVKFYALIKASASGVNR